MSDKTPGVGHNSGEVAGIAGDHLKAIVERLERLDEEKRAVAEDMKEVYAEAKGSGLDTKVIRKIIARRKRDADEVAEEEALLDLYLQAIIG